MRQVDLVAQPFGETVQRLLHAGQGDVPHLDQGGKLALLNLIGDIDAAAVDAVDRAEGVGHRRAHGRDAAVAEVARRAVDDRQSGVEIDDDLAGLAGEVVDVEILGDLVDRHVALVLELSGRFVAGDVLRDLLVELDNVVELLVDHIDDARDLAVGIEPQLLHVHRQGVDLPGQGIGVIEHDAPQAVAFRAGG